MGNVNQCRRRELCAIIQYLIKHTLISRRNSCREIPFWWDHCATIIAIFIVYFSNNRAKTPSLHLFVKAGRGAMAIHDELSLHEVKELLQSQIANGSILLCFVVDDIPCHFKCAVSHNHASFQSIANDYSKQFCKKHECIFNIAFGLLLLAFVLLYQNFLRRCSRTWHCFLCIIYNSVPIFLEAPLSLYLLTVVKRPVFYRITVYSLTLRHFLGQRHTYNHFSDSRIDRSSSVIVWRSKQS